jgi:thermostable 8-oxoguanine DNA glycosylase
MGSQICTTIIGDKYHDIVLPGPDDYVLDDITWGRFDSFFTPAYWATQAWLSNSTQKYSNYKLGDTLLEEIVACLLGGYGIPSEVGLAMFQKVKKSGLLTKNYVTDTEVHAILVEPVIIGNRQVTYRFHNIKSKYISHAINYINQHEIPSCKGKEFRDWLSENINGIGPKTASWITRNWLSSDDVAIIDIHLKRAGLFSGYYKQKDIDIDNYFEMEEKFLSFASAITVRASILDTIIWSQMKMAGPTAAHIKHPAPSNQLPLFNN